MVESSNHAYYILENLKKDPDKTVLVVGEEAATAGEVHKRISEIAHLLKEQNGLKKGQRVLIASSPCVDFYCIAVAVIAVGGTLVILDPSMSFDRINHCISIAKVSFFVYPSGSKLRFLKYLFPAVRAIQKMIEIESCGPVELLEPTDVVPATDAVVTFTTGSTGMPKLLVREHSFLLKQSKSVSLSYEKIAGILGIKAKENELPLVTNLPVVPLHSLKIGCLVAVVPKFAECDPALVIKTMKKYGFSILVGSPAFACRLARYASNHQIMLPLEVVGVGGAPIYRSDVRMIASTVKEKKLAIIYGSTEAEPISIIPAKEKMALEESRPDGLCVGKPVMEGTVKIISASDEPIEGVVDVEEMELPSGEIGEIILTGWHVNTEQVEKKRLIQSSDGKQWVRIEDGGYMDPEGRIWLVGRVKWRVVDKKTGATHWSIIVEQKVLERNSLITFVSYMSHSGRAYMFVEAPNGLPQKELEGLKQFIKNEGIPVDELVIKKHIKKDRRHASKPDTSALFSGGSTALNYAISSLWFVITKNPLILVGIVVLIFILLLSIVLCCCNSF